MITKIPDWFIFALLALVLYGLWAFFPKLAGNYINSKSFIIFETLGVVIVGIIFLFATGFQPEFHTKGIIFAILTGLAGTIGTFVFFLGITRGKASVVVTMTALYPIVTIMLAAILLREPITIKQGLGIIFALVAMVLFTI